MTEPSADQSSKYAGHDSGSDVRQTGADPLASLKRRLPAWEPWLVLLAGPPLVFAEVFPLAVQGVGLAWIGALWVARRWAKGRWSRRTPLDLPIALLLLTLPGALVAVGSAAPTGDLVAGLSRAASLIFAVALFFALANAVRWPRHAYSAAGWLLLAGTGLGVVGLVSVDWLAKYPLLGEVVEGLPRLIRDVPHPTIRSGVHPNQLASLLILFVPLAVALLLWPGSDDGEGDGTRPAGDADDKPLGHLSRRRLRALRPPAHLELAAVLALLVSIPVLVLTQSRGAWLALAVALAGMAVTYVISNFRRVSAETAGAVAAVALTLLVAGVPMGAYAVSAVRGEGPPTGLAAVGQSIADRISAAGAAPSGPTGAARPSSPDSVGGSAVPGTGATDGLSVAGRVRLWRDAARLIRAHPVSGIGLHNFPLVHGYQSELGGRYVYQGFPHAHNVLVQAALDFGLPGLLAVVWLYGATAWVALRAFRRLRGTDLAPLVIGLSFGLLAHGLHGLVDAVAIGSKPGFLVWAFVGVLVGIRYRAFGWVGRRGGRRPDEART